MAKKKEQKVETVKAAKMSVRNVSDVEPTSNINELKSKLKTNDDSLDYLKDSLKATEKEDTLSSLKDKLSNVVVEEEKTETVEEAVVEEAVVEAIEEPIAEKEEIIIEEEKPEVKEEIVVEETKPKKEKAKKKDVKKVDKKPMNSNTTKEKYAVKDIKNGNKLYRNVESNGHKIKMNFTTIIEASEEFMEKTTSNFIIKYKDDVIVNSNTFNGELFFGIDYLVVNSTTFHYMHLSIINF